MADVRIGVMGCGGRMGRMLVAEVHATEGCRLSGGCEAPGNPVLGQDIGTLAGIGPVGLAATPERGDVFAASDVVIDFTIPAASVAHAQFAAAQAKALVIGTTGFDVAQSAALEAAAARAPIVWAPNMSLAVNLLLSLVEQVAARLGDDYDVEILEMHHRYKVDAPSGTALALGAAAAKARGIDLDGHSQRVRDGLTGERRRGDIGFASLRGGDNAGEHVVMFASTGERLELAHRATSRVVYARGAVRAARWAVTRPPGLYRMKDVLGL
jgi:4-hydroxy-tetrahydrodipicolinate reductase